MADELDYDAIIDEVEGKRPARKPPPVDDTDDLGARLSPPLGGRTTGGKPKTTGAAPGGTEGKPKTIGGVAPDATAVPREPGLGGVVVGWGGFRPVRSIETAHGREVTDTYESPAEGRLPIDDAAEMETAMGLRPSRSALAYLPPRVPYGVPPGNPDIRGKGQEYGRGALDRAAEVRVPGGATLAPGFLPDTPKERAPSFVREVIGTEGSELVPIPPYVAGVKPAAPSLPANRRDVSFVREDAGRVVRISEQERQWATWRASVLDAARKAGHPDPEAVATAAEWAISNRVPGITFGTATRFAAEDPQALVDAVAAAMGR